MWQHHWRSIDITVNGSSVSMRVDTTLGALMAGNDDFGAVPGRLLSVTSDVLGQHGGEPVSTAVNGHEVAARDREDTAVPEHAAVTVESGKDTTEEHDVRREPVPHGSNIVIAGGAVQRVRQHGRDGVREIWVGKKSGKKADKGVHATFFNLGPQAAAFPAVEQRALAEGHQIANHSNTHNGAIVLMHDGRDDRSQDVKALPHIIDDLRA